LPNIPQYGKITKSFFDTVIYPNLGAKNGKILVGPSLGVDTCVIRIGKNQVMVATTDPISYIQDLGPKDSAWQSVNLIASDLATSGFPPQFALFDFNLPPTMKSSVFRKYWDAVSRECEKLGIAIVGGHTSRFEGLTSTVIGAGSMFSIGREDEYLTSAGGMVGDKVLVTKRAAISTTAILARAFPNTIRKKAGESVLRKSKQYLRNSTIVRDALTAVKIGVRNNGISAMHDATEGGLLSALYELASASNTGLRVNLSTIPVSNETRSICKIFRINPYICLSEGSLVFSCIPSKVDTVISKLASAGIEATLVGELIPRKMGIVKVAGGREIPIKYPVIDPYWRAYYEAKRSSWN